MLRHFSKSLVFRDISKLALGAGLGQVVTMLAAPLIARQYGPESFGEQSALLSIASPLITLTSLAFPIAIVIARTDREALALARMAVLGSLILAPLATALFLFDGMWLLHLLGLEKIGAFVVLIPVLVVLITMNMSAGYIMARNGAHGLSAKASVTAATIGSFSKLALGAVWPGTLSLIVGNAISYLVAPLLTLRMRRRMATGSPGPSLSQLKDIAKRNRDFPLLRAPQNFVAALSQSLPVVGLTAGFGPETAGFYAIAIVLAGAPIGLVGNAVQSVLYPRLTEAAREGENTTKLLGRATLGLLLVGAPFFLIIAAFGPWLFATLLGPEWQEAGVYSALLVPWLWLGFLNRPAVSLIPALGLQHGLLIYELVTTAVKLLVILVCLNWFDSARWIVGIFSIVGAIAYFFLIVWVFWSSREARVRMH